ncbi:hypothetical protein [Burkholderia sp. Bp9031]|uniref:hypothetical protein n=1 Tax=Burkholderia sp. Bp9031 TaxID=2184566 RepID=UPI0011CF5EBE|nr:hypothetical protein [Burkholderia sp. Bp9031]
MPIEAAVTFCFILQITFELLLKSITGFRLVNPENRFYSSLCFWDSSVVCSAPVNDRKSGPVIRAMQTAAHDPWGASHPPSTAGEPGFCVHTASIHAIEPGRRGEPVGLTRLLKMTDFNSIHRHLPNFDPGP